MSVVGPIQAGYLSHTSNVASCCVTVRVVRHFSEHVFLLPFSFPPGKCKFRCFTAGATFSSLNHCQHSAGAGCTVVGPFQKYTTCRATTGESITGSFQLNCIALYGEKLKVMFCCLCEILLRLLYKYDFSVEK